MIKSVQLSALALNAATMGKSKLFSVKREKAGDLLVATFIKPIRKQQDIESELSLFKKH